MSFGQNRVSKNVPINQFDGACTPVHTRSRQSNRNSSFFLSTMTPWTNYLFRRRRGDDTTMMTQCDNGEASFADGTRQENTQNHRFYGFAVLILLFLTVILYTLSSSVPGLKSYALYAFSMLTLAGSIYCIIKMLFCAWWGRSQQWNMALLLQKLGLIDPRMLRDYRHGETNGTKFVDSRYHPQRTLHPSNTMAQANLPVHNNGTRMKASHGSIGGNEMAGSRYPTNSDDVATKYPYSPSTNGGVVNNLKMFFTNHTPQGLMRAKTPISKFFHRFGMTPAPTQIKQPTYSNFNATGTKEMNDLANLKNQKNVEMLKSKLFDQPITGLRADEYGNVQYSNTMQIGREASRQQASVIPTNSEKISPTLYSNNIFADQRKTDPLDILKSKQIPQSGFYQKWNSQYSDLAKQLYGELNIGSHINEWAEACKWFMSNVCKQRYDGWEKSNEMVVLLVEQLKNWYPDSKASFDSLLTIDAKSNFLVDNCTEMEEVGKQKKAPQIGEFVEKRKQLVECMDKLLSTTKNRSLQSVESRKDVTTNEQQSKYGSSKYHYILYKIQAFGNNQWNSSDLLKCDPRCHNLAGCSIVMNLFIQYMDDILFPKLDLFRAKHYLQISTSEMNNLNIYGSVFKNVAIVCVQQYNSTLFHEQENKSNDYSLPYFFVVFDEELTKNQSSRHWGGKENRWMNNNTNKMKVGAWYTEPGQRNVFDCIALFALFIHRFLGGYLGHVNVAEKTNFLKTVLEL